MLEARCTATSEALSDRLEGELRGLRRWRVARHLARCGRCRATLSSLKRLVDALRTIRDAEPASGGSSVEGALARIEEGSGVDGRG